MFTNPLSDEEYYRVFFTNYADRHFMKRFSKDYPGKRWQVTVDSIYQDLRRVHSMQMTQQVDELKRGKDCKLFKYDFRVAQTNESPKKSGNRCVVFLDESAHRQDVLFVYSKGDLPKNVQETIHIYSIVAEQFPELWARLD